MIRSMTGYGRAVETIDGREITAELRSVNNRYLDCTVKMPRLYAFAEDSVKTHVKAAISRGKVDVFIAVNVMEDMQMRISVNHPVLEGYLSAMRSIASDYGVRDDISVTALSRLPDVFVVEKAEEDEEKLTQDILSVVDKALEKFTAMRTTEGAALEADLRGRAATILTLVEKVEQRSPVTLAEYRARLTEKMQEVLQSTTIDEGRILQEAAIYADKIAVDEETVRLRSHLNQLETMLTNGGAIGRKLDFLLQELNRESNTIGSKGNDLEQARTVVEIKAELEKIREQTQNIE
ncbi:MAG: YicC/YloC family endoribonuclease [Oscillospiraceae bacterium]|nr:YicC/YloC family endoribonuclease [Oscillospiraceae bacterium]